MPDSRQKNKKKHYIWTCMPAPPPPPTYCHLRMYCQTLGRAFQHSSLPVGRNPLVFPSHAVSGISLAHSTPGMGLRNPGHRCGAHSFGVYALMGLSLSVRAPVGPSLGPGDRSLRHRCAAPLQGLWTPPRS